MTHDPARIWPRIQDEMRQAVPASIYEIWLAPLRAAEVDGHDVVVDVPRELHGWIAERYSRVLQTSAAAVLGPQATVELRPCDDVAAERRAGDRTDGDTAPLRRTTASGRVGRITRRATAADEPSASADDEPAGDEGEPLNPKFTFDQFVLGPANRFAHAASLAVAELPAQAYNPLFIYGPPGVGKTHLLHSIGNYVRAYGGGLTVRYTTVETFTNQFVGALRTRGIERFKERYRRVGVLLIDDVQFLAQKARTEEEFFHTFNALQSGGSQLVLTSDRVPRDLDGVQDRLRERFEAGLVTDIQPPDAATRLTVLRKRVAHDGVELRDAAVLELITERVTTNIRALEGALIRVVAFSSLTGRPLDLALATEVLDGLHPRESAPGTATAFTTSRHPDLARTGPPAAAAQPLTMERIQDATARAFGLERADLVSTRRTAAVAWARQLAMYLVREHTDATLPAIGRCFGGRNHTTVMHACRRAAERLSVDPEAYEVARRLTAELGLPVHDDGADRRC